MKILKFINTLTILFIPFIIYGQTTFKLYDETFHESLKNDNQYYRIISIDSITGKPIGLVKDYYINGKLQWKGKCLDAECTQFDSVATWYFPDGSTENIAEYKNGIINGVLKRYYENGKPYLIIEYKNGKKNGVELQYNDKDSLIYKANFIEDSLNGKEIIVEDNGYKHVHFYANNKRYIEDLQKFYPNGRLFSEKRFLKDSTLIKEIFYSQSGQVEKEISIKNIKNKNEVYQSIKFYYFTNRQITKEETYINNKKNGKFKYWQKNGKLALIQKYANDSLVGFKQLDTNYTDSDSSENKIRNGEVISKYFRGLTSIENYKNDKLHGKCLYINSNGDTNKIEYFENGILDGLQTIFSYNKIVEKNNYLKGKKNDLCLKFDFGLTYKDYYKNDTIKFHEVYFNSQRVVSQHFNLNEIVDTIWYLNNKIKQISFTKDSKLLTIYLWDEHGNLIFKTEPKLNKNFAAKSDNDCIYGLKNADNQWVVQPKYSTISEFINNRAIVTQNELYGIIDINGKEIYPLQEKYVISFLQKFSFNRQINLMKNEGISYFPDLFLVNQKNTINDGILNLKTKKVLNSEGTIEILNYNLKCITLKFGNELLVIDSALNFKIGASFILHKDDINFINKDKQKINFFSYGYPNNLYYNHNSIIDYNELFIVQNPKSKLLGIVDNNLNTIIPIQNNKIFQTQKNINNEYKFDSTFWAENKNGFDVYNLEGHIISRIAGKTVGYSLEQHFVKKSNSKIDIFNNKGNILISDVDSVKVLYHPMQCIFIWKNKKQSLYFNDKIIIADVDTFYVINDEGDETDLREFIIVKNNHKIGLISKSGKLTLPIIYESIFLLYNKEFAVKQNGYFGIVDSLNNLKVPFKYKFISKISESLFLANNDKIEEYNLVTGQMNNFKFNPYNFLGALTNNSVFVGAENFTSCLLDNQLKPVTKFEYEFKFQSNKNFDLLAKKRYLIFTSKNNISGVMNLDGKIIFQVNNCRNLELLDDSILELIYTNNHVQRIDINGKFLSKPIKGNILFTDKDYIYYSDSLGKCGVVDINGNIILPPKYLYISPSKNAAQIFNCKKLINGIEKWILVSLNGTENLKLTFDNPLVFVGNFAIIEKYNDESLLFGVVDNNLNIILPANYSKIEFCNNYFWAKQTNGKYIQYDSFGRKISTNEYHQATYLVGGYSLVFHRYIPEIIDGKGQKIISNDKLTYFENIEKIKWFIYKNCPSKLKYLKFYEFNNFFDFKNKNLEEDELVKMPLKIKNEILINILEQIHGFNNKDIMYYAEINSFQDDLLNISLKTTFNSYDTTNSVYEKNGFDEEVVGRLRLLVKSGKIEVVSLDNLLNLNQENNNYLNQLINSKFLNLMQDNSSQCNSKLTIYYDYYTLNKNGFTFYRYLDYTRNEYKVNSVEISFAEIDFMIRDRNLLNLIKE